MLKAVTILVLGALAATPAAAQRGGAKAVGVAKSGGIRGKGQPGAAQFERFQRMSPQQREKWLSNLPAGRKEQIEKRWENYQKLPDEDRDRLGKQLENFRQLPPERQEAMRRLSRRFHEMPDERKTMLREEMQTLRGLDEDGRRERIHSDEFRNKYSAGEKQLLEDLSRVLAQDE
jgi:hypothetical protein